MRNERSHPLASRTRPNLQPPFSTRGNPLLPHPDPRGSRLGLRLFAGYLLLYAGFVLASAFGPSTMAGDAPFGLNVALFYGLGLIAAAVLLAIVYAWLRRQRPTADGSAHR